MAGGIPPFLAGGYYCPGVHPQGEDQWQDWDNPPGYNLGQDFGQDQ